MQWRTWSSAAARSRPSRHPRASSGMSWPDSWQWWSVIGRTLPGELGSQASHRGTDSGLRCPKGYALGCGNFGGGPADDARQNQGPALRGRERRQGRPQPGGVVAGERRCLGVGGPAHQQQQPRGIDRHLAAGTRYIDGQIPGDRRYPRAQGAAGGVEGRPETPDPLEGLLGNVFGEMGITEHGEGYAVDAVLEPPHQCNRRFLIATADGGQQRLLGKPAGRQPDAHFGVPEDRGACGISRRVLSAVSEAPGPSLSG